MSNDGRLHEVILRTGCHFAGRGFCEISGNGFTSFQIGPDLLLRYVDNLNKNTIFYFFLPQEYLVYLSTLC